MQPEFNGLFEEMVFNTRKILKSLNFMQWTDHWVTIVSILWEIFNGRINKFSCVKFLNTTLVFAEYAY
jgi:hypothetical protein